MKLIEVKSKVGSDGVLHLRLPMGKTEANREVKVTVQSAGDSENERQRQPAWQRFVRTTAGSIDNPTFKRHDQGQLAEAEDLFS